VRRDVRLEHDPWKYQALVIEQERTADGLIATVGVVLLTGRNARGAA
jgi:hypothetical protein